MMNDWLIGSCFFRDVIQNAICQLSEDFSSCDQQFSLCLGQSEFERVLEDSNSILSLWEVELQKLEPDFTVTDTCSDAVQFPQ